MRHSLKTLWFGICGLLILLAANSFFTFRAFQRVNADNSLIERTQRVLFQAERLENFLVDAETGQRGYLYTGDARYLEPYNRTASQVNAQIERVAELLGDNVQQQQRLRQIRELADVKLTELAQTIALYRSGQGEQARTVVLSNFGKNTMDDVRRLIGEIRSEESRQQAAAQAETKRSTQLATLAFIAATAIASAALLLFGFLLARENRKFRAAALAVHEQKEWLDTTLRSIGDAVIATDTEGRVVFLNQVACTLTGYSGGEAHARPLTEVFPIFNETTRQPVEDPVAKVIRAGTVVGLANHTILCRRDGIECAIDDSAAPIRSPDGRLIGVVLVFRDVTQQRALEVALRNSEKLATAGRFAATMAHEINNPLESVMNSLFLLRSDPGLSGEGRQWLRMADEELNRVAAVARQTLGFYKDTSSHSLVDVPQLLDEILSLYKRRIEGRRIQVVRNYETAAICLGICRRTPAGLF
jgi:PAS domain S-box-containing protein